MRIAVTGGRDHIPTSAEISAFEDLWWSLTDEGHPQHSTTDDILFEGGATGLDEWARGWAQAKGIPVATISVNNRIDGPWPAAGPVRSRRMLKDAKVEALIAFIGGQGTFRAKEAGKSLDILVYEYDPIIKQFDFYRRVVRRGAEAGK